MTSQTDTTPTFTSQLHTADTRQAIETRYAGPTNHRPGRIIARAEVGKLTVQWEHGLNIDKNHARAAALLARKFGWKGMWQQGGNAAGDGYVFTHSTQPAFTVTEA